MIGLIQRVLEAKVVVDGNTVGQIQTGILLLLGVERADTEAQAQRLLERVVNYRIFEDSKGRMNRSLLDVQGGLLVVPQFTLPADTQRGNRPSFTPAAPPEQGKQLFNYFCAQIQAQGLELQSGVFGADMQVHLINNGPVTFWLKT
ncbi:D-aminoacyl-tRNA deacylase [uncultured Thiothrix sp.]|jgi:D-tyrosyl-tRNA(Tyr) deacylase|uniref:D-aminoacyl-tRNA deacylase n=1 Tax=uncultured Thiothrix sp. TaxID=223185 RepID=UPI0026196DE1|nr:D-aminoacyl-tRNA deacylase [uncultured Thiothrix sp.]HMT94571.1 D-aminoacyl-tRNA deacylase [Thiolinea sp.]